MNLEGHRSVGGMRASLYNAMPDGGRRRADRVHGGLREAARVSGIDAFKILTLNNISVRGPRAAAARSLRSRVGDRPARRDPAALGRHARHGDPRQRAAPSAAPAPARTTFRSRSCRKRGVPVFNAPGANANAVKELVIAGLLLAARNICRRPGSSCASSRAAGDALDEAVEKGKKKFVGLRAAGAHARRRRPRRDRRRGRERGARARHEGARLRPADHGAARLAAVVGRAAGASARRPVRALRHRHRARAAHSRRRDKLVNAARLRADAARRRAS